MDINSYIESLDKKQPCFPAVRSVLSLRHNGGQAVKSTDVQALLGTA